MSDNFNNNEDLNQTEEQPWERKFGEDENLKNRQFSRSARNSGGKAVAPLSNVLLFVFLIVIVAPVLFMWWFSIVNSSNQVKPRTADDVMLTKTVETTTATPETTAGNTILYYLTSSTLIPLFLATDSIVSMLFNPFNVA